MEISLEIIVGDVLRQHAFRLAVAESCTGGLIAHRITNVPGSSLYFVGGMVTYGNEAKEKILGVKAETIAAFGAVSEQVAQEMARGVRLAMDADVGLAVTGIAGPGGGTPEKPVGLTWIGLSMPQGEEAWRFVWQGSRVENKEASAEKALQILVKVLSEGI